MASTITLQGTINFALPYVQFRPLAIGTSNEPAISIANTVLQTILGPPFCWRWNRAKLTPFSTVVGGTTDYSQNIPTFGFLESATCNNFQMEIKSELTSTGTGDVASRPNHISAELDDNAGNITFRLMPVPDAVYSIAGNFQQKPILITALTSTWSPIPDEYSYVYQFGFLSLAMAYSDDPRFMQFSQMFKGHLLGASTGLDETQKAIFMERWDRTIANSQASGLRTQQGVQARAL